jgi:hypothetical protein
MATFPALAPQTRTYTPGQTAATPIGTLNGDELSVRHSNGSVGHTLRLGYVGLTQAQYYQIVSHYNYHGRFIPFDISTAALAGSELTFPANHVWIYARSPEANVQPGVISVTVTLELIPPDNLPT